MPRLHRIHRLPYPVRIWCDLVVHPRTLHARWPASDAPGGDTDQCPLICARYEALHGRAGVLLLLQKKNQKQIKVNTNSPFASFLHCWSIQLVKQGATLWRHTRHAATRSANSKTTKQCMLLSRSNSLSARSTSAGTLMHTDRQTGGQGEETNA